LREEEEEEDDDDDDDDINIISAEKEFFLQLLKFTSTKKQSEEKKNCLKKKKKGDVLKECLTYRRISNPEAIIIELEILKARNWSILLLYSTLYLSIPLARNVIQTWGAHGL
jgi:hypothetical protein